MTDPFPDDRAYLDAELERLECRLRAAVETFDGPVDEFGGLYVSRAEVERLLGMDGAGREPDPVSAETGRLESVTADLRERRRATREAGRDLAVERLVDRFDLDELDRELLVLALAPDLDEAYATVYAFLQDDATRTRPTVGFLAGLLEAADRLDVRAAFSPGAPLVDHEVVHLVGEGPLPIRSVRVDERIVAVLLGERDLGPPAGDAVTLSAPARPVPALPADRSRKRVLEDLAAADGPPAPFVAVSGPAGTGKRAQVEAVCAERDQPLLTVHAGRVDPAEVPTVVADAVADARLRDAAVHVAGVPAEAGRTAARAVRRLDDHDGPVFVSTETPLSTTLLTAVEAHEVVPLSVAPAGYDERRRYWAGVEDLPAGAEPSDLAAKFRLTRGAIDDAMATARAVARASDGPLSAAHVYEGCRSQSSERLADLAQRVEPNEGWDDIVLPTEAATQLRELAARIGDQGTVYEDWGFAETSTLGNGLVALFSGQSGTGKTMAAEVIAADAGLGLYKVDLSAVVSKYVGETESNLGEIFDEAADSDAILLFDEADALFGERSDVSDAHDRYANVEVNYLLQRVEEHDGTVLLTTNLEANIDDAFRRRVHVSVEFPFPDRRSRAAIWRRSFPESTPVGDLDYEFLGGLKLSGGNIRNAALTAAFLAADEGGEIGMSHAVRGVKREFQKTGTPVDPERFGEYREFLK